MMPFWSEKSENYKAKLEHKMCYAKEAPDENFDLSDCNLSEVPSGVYSMCRVFRKEKLFLQNNNISSLNDGGSLKDLNQLLVLNLMNNKLSSLPTEIYQLVQLQSLNLQFNNLKKMPSTFARLVNLRQLNLKGNKLASFPPEICSLINLEFLNICNNSKIKALPKELCCLSALQELFLDAEYFSYPSTEICTGGCETIMRFLCSENGLEYIPPEKKSICTSMVTPETEVSETDKKSVEMSPLSASYQQYQRTKDRRQQELIEIEEALKENFAAQSSISAVSSQRKKKLLEDMAQEQERMECEIIQLQSKKEHEKKNLLDVLTNIENHSAKLVDQLMNLNDRTKQLEKMSAVLERDRIENEEIFSIKQEKLEQFRKKEILEAMTEMLHHDERYVKYEADKCNMVKRLQNDENESNLKLFSILQGKELDQQILINRLNEEEEYQKEAFKVLQLQKDIQHQEIAHQINLIEKELSNLTVAELKKKELKIGSDLASLAEHRITLASLLADLMSAKEKREKELKERLEQMDLKRAHETEDFWIIQYQKLLDRKPKGVATAEMGVDNDIKSVLLAVPAIEYLPLFASKRIDFSTLLKFSVKDLKKIGILDEDTCQAILINAQEHSKWMRASERYLIPEFSNSPTPSAPPVEQDSEESTAAPTLEPSAPPLSPDSDQKLWCQTECVICMTAQTSAVFLPCGHVCCCQNCSHEVELCPMCRTTISSRFTLVVA